MENMISKYIAEIQIFLVSEIALNINERKFTIALGDKKVLVSIQKNDALNSNDGIKPVTRPEKYFLRRIQELYAFDELPEIPSI